jgi:hypothetical protein
MLMGDFYQEVLGCPELSYQPAKIIFTQA